MASGYPDFEGGKRRVFGTGDWAADVGVDKSFYGGAGALPAHSESHVDYLVTPGKTLYLSNASFGSFAELPADSELNQICALEMQDLTMVTNIWFQGGNGGGAVVFTTPLVIPGGHQIRILVYNLSNHSSDAFFSVDGWEV